MNRTWSVVMVGVLAFAVAVGVRPVRPAAGEGSAQARFAAKEFGYTPKALTVKDGRIQFVVTNSGTIEHSFVIDALRVKSGLIKPGQAVTLAATARKGTYTIYCDVPGHKEIGMTATLVVK